MTCLETSLLIYPPISVDIFGLEAASVHDSSHVIWCMLKEGLSDPADDLQSF